MIVICILIKVGGLLLFGCFIKLFTLLRVYAYTKPNSNSLSLSHSPCVRDSQSGSLFLKIYSFRAKKAQYYSSIKMDHGKPVKAAATMSFTDMKKSQSVLDFEELFPLTEVDQKVGVEFPSHKTLDDVSVFTAESSAAANHSSTFPFRNQVSLSLSRPISHMYAHVIWI